MWVPIVGLLIGGIAGALIYNLGIHPVLVARKEMASGSGEPRGETVREEPEPENFEQDVQARGRTVRDVR